jgi:hypothetical protein
MKAFPSERMPVPFRLSGVCDGGADAFMDARSHFLTMYGLIQR